MARSHLIWSGRGGRSQAKFRKAFLRDGLKATTSSAPAEVASRHFLNWRSYHTFFSLVVAALLISIPAASQTPEDQIGVRLIVVKTEAEATALLNQIQSGHSFEEVAKKHSIDSSAKDGGYLGLLRLTELNANLRRILNGLQPGQISPSTAIGGEFFIVLRLTSEEAHWISSYKAGLAAF